MSEQPQERQPLTKPLAPMQYLPSTFYRYASKSVDVHWPGDRVEVNTADGWFDASKLLEHEPCSLQYAQRIYGPPAVRPLLTIRYTRDVPTPDERAKWEAERAEAIPRIPGELVRLNALTGVEREVLDLHAPDEYGYCQGCDGGPDYTGDFPCRTVELIAKRNGINLGGYSDWLAHHERTER